MSDWINISNNINKKKKVNNYSSDWQNYAYGNSLDYKPQKPKSVKPSEASPSSDYKQYTPGYNYELEQQVKSKEAELGIESQSKRSVLDRVFDALNIGQFAIQGALYNATDGNKDTSILSGLIEGIKSANPFGDDYTAYEKSFTDVLDNLGWKKQNKDGSVLKPSTWTVNDVARGLVGFLGDVLLDPTTYITGGLSTAKTFLKGTGTKVGKETIEKMSVKTAKELLEEMAEKGGKELIGEITEESAEKIANRVNKLKGIATKEGHGIGIGFKEFPFAEKLGIDHLQKTFVSADKVRELGDKTVSPLYNKITTALNDSLPGRLFQNKSKVRQLAKSNPELLAKELIFDDMRKGLSSWLQKENEKVIEYGMELAKNFSESEQKLIADLIENSKAMSTYKTFTMFADTEEGKKWYDALVTWRDELENTVVNIYNSETLLKQNADKIQKYEDLLGYINGIIENANTSKLDNFDHFLGRPNTSKIVNEVLYKSVDDIKTHLKSMPEFADLSDDTLDEVALTYRGIADNYINEQPLKLRKNLQGQVTTKEILYDVIKKQEPTLPEEQINKIIDDIIEQQPVDKVVNNVDEVATSAIDNVVKTPIDDMLQTVDLTGNRFERVLDEIVDSETGEYIGKYTPEKLDELNGVKRVVEPTLIENATKRNFNVKLNINGKEVEVGLLDLNDAKGLNQRAKLKYVNELIKTDKRLSAQIKSVHWKAPNSSLNDFLNNFYNNDIDKIIYNKYKYSPRYEEIQKALRSEFGEFAKLSDSGKKARLDKAKYYEGLSDEKFKETMFNLKLEDYQSKKPFDDFEKIANKDRSKWISDLDNRQRVTPEYIGKDVEAFNSDFYANAREELAMSKYGKSYNNVHEVGQKKIDEELNKLLDDTNASGEVGKVVKIKGGQEKVYNSYKYKGINILEPAEKSAKNATKIEYATEWIDNLPEKVQQFIAKNNVEIRLEDFNVGSADSLYDSSNNLITMLHRDNSTAKGLNKLRAEMAFDHEVAHAIGSSYSKRHKVPSGWANARKLDGVEWVSDYAKEIGNQSEDFADAVAKYLLNPEVFIEKFPNRAKLIQKSLDELPIDLESVNKLEKVVIPRTAFSTIEEQIKTFKLQRDKLIQDSLGNPSMEDVEKWFDELNNVLSKRSEFEKYIATNYPNDYKKFTEKIRLGLDDMNVSDEIKNTVKEVKRRFSEIADLEIEKGYLDVDKHIENYLYHMLNPKYEKEVKMFREVPDILNDLLGTDGKFNPHNISRKFVKGYKIGDVTLKDGTKREINDVMKELFKKDEFFVEEIAPIYTARALKHNELMYDDKFQQSLLDMFGTQIRGRTKIPQGEKIVISVSELRRYVNKSKAGQPHDVLKSLGFTETILDNYKAPLIEITNENLRNFMPYAEELKFFSLPPSIYEYANKMGKIQLENDTNSLLNIYDRFLHLYKLNVTAVSPGFHVRNAISNYFQNWLDTGSEVFNPKTNAEASQILKYSKGNGKSGKIVSRFGKEYTYDEIIEYARRTGVYDSGFFASEVPQKLNSKLDPRVDSILDKINPLKDSFVPYEMGRNVGNIVENHARLTNFIANLKRGLDPDEAGEHTIKFLFDYGDLTDFEKNFMRRVIPFYTWARKNIPLQLEQMIEQPQKYAMIGKGLKAIERGVPEEDRVDKNYVNDFAQDWVQLPFTTKNLEGREEPVFWNPNLPYQDISRIPNPLRPIESMKGLVSDLTPAIKIPLELMANKNMFFDSPINRGIGHTEPAPGYTQPLNYMKLHNGQYVDLNRISPELRYILDQISSLSNIGEFIEKSGSDRFVHGLNYLGGIKLASYDYDKYKTWALRDRLKQLNAK